MTIKVLGNDDNDSTPVPNKQNGTYKPEKDNGYLILPIVLIMGAILICGLWITSAPCPSMTCPNVTTSCPEAIIPACPSCPDCNPTIQCTLNQTNMEQYRNITLTSITLFNSTNTNQNSTVTLGTLNRTAPFNITALGLGENVTIGVNYG